MFTRPPLNHRAPVILPVRDPDYARTIEIRLDWIERNIWQTTSGLSMALALLDLWRDTAPLGLYPICLRQ